MRRSLAWGVVLWVLSLCAGCVLLVDGEAALELSADVGGDAGEESGDLRAMILDGPEVAAAGGAAHFEMGCEPHGCELQCAQDGEAFESCGSTYVWADLSEGDHVLAARAWKGDEVSAEVLWSFDVGPPVGLEVSGELSVERFFRDVGQVEVGCEAAGCEISCGLWELEGSCELASCGRSLGLSCAEPGTLAVTVPGPGRYMLQVEGCDPLSGACDTWEEQFEVEAPRWQQVSAGGAHTCAILETGALFCWGDNAFNQLGSGSLAGGWQGRRVPGSWVQVASGESHSCAVDTQGRLHCWGDNATHQVSSQQAASLGVTRVGQSVGWLGVRSGSGHSCAWRQGQLYCWGSGEWGQIGPASSYANGVVVEISAPSSAWSGDVAVGANHSCAVAGSQVWCFGDRREGAAGYLEGDGEAGDVLEVSGAQGLSRLVAGDRYSCGVSAAGDVRCWGVGAEHEGEDPSLHTSAQTVTGVSATATLSGGAGHLCAIDESGALRCWGANELRQVSGNVSANLAPVTRIASEKTWASVSAGRAHTCAIEAQTRRLYCWGGAEKGRLGSEVGGAAVGAPREVAWEY